MFGASELCVYVTIYSIFILRASRFVLWFPTIAYGSIKNSFYRVENENESTNFSMDKIVIDWNRILSGQRDSIGKRLHFNIVFYARNQYKAFVAGGWKTGLLDPIFMINYCTIQFSSFASCLVLCISNNYNVMLCFKWFMDSSILRSGLNWTDDLPQCQTSTLNLF